jgi:hypothetical protein
MGRPGQARERVNFRGTTMRVLHLLGLCAVALAIAAPAVSAKHLKDFNNVKLEEAFIARLSERDHFNSRGERLNTIAHIIRQDRANFHRFNRRDPEDQPDGIFHEYENRRILEILVDRASVENGAVAAIIINQTPLVRVNIYSGMANGSWVRFVIVEIL